MIDFLVAHIFEIVAIVTAIIIFLLQVRKKSLSFSILTNTNLVLVSENIKEKIEIRYDGKSIQDVRLLEIKFQNTGNVAILPKDFIEPLTIELPKNSQVLSIGIIDEHSLGVEVNDELSSQYCIVFKNILLNAKDSFIVKLLLGKIEKEPKILGRIVGVEKIGTVGNDRKKLIKTSMNYWFIVGLIYFLAAGIIYITSGIKPAPQAMILWLMPFFIVPVISIFWNLE